MKRDLETIKRKSQKPHDEEDEDFKPAAKKRSVTTPTRIYVKDCNFCEKVKYIRSPLLESPQRRLFNSESTRS